jgi:hypothetical protein
MISSELLNSNIECDTTGLFRLGQQRLVVFLRRLVLIWADDLGDIPIEIAVAPLANAVVAPHVGQLPRRVAPREPPVAPVLSIQIEVLRRKEIYRQRLNARGRTGRRVALPRVEGQAESAHRHRQRNGSCDSRAHGSHNITSLTFTSHEL